MFLRTSRALPLFPCVLSSSFSRMSDPRDAGAPRSATGWRARAYTLLLLSAQVSGAQVSARLQCGCSVVAGVGRRLHRAADLAGTGGAGRAVRWGRLTRLTAWLRR